MILKIHKKYLEKVERYTKFGAGGKFNPYAVRYIFNLPEGSEYENYALTVDTDDYRYSDGELIVESVGANRERKGNYYYLDIEDTQVFSIARYKGREEGKRYKRYELNGAELHAIFNYNKSVETLPLVVAEVKRYLNNGTRDAGSVVSSEIKIGRSDGTWLYVDEERRKVKSKGVRVLGELPFESKDELEEAIKEFYREKGRLLKDIMQTRSSISELDSISTKAQRLGFKDVKDAIEKICSDKSDQLKWDIEIQNERLAQMERDLLQRIESVCKK